MTAPDGIDWTNVVASSLSSVDDETLLRLFYRLRPSQLLRIYEEHSDWIDACLLRMLLPGKSDDDEEECLELVVSILSSLYRQQESPQKLQHIDSLLHVLNVRSSRKLAVTQVDVDMVLLLEHVLHSTTPLLDNDKEWNEHLVKSPEILLSRYVSSIPSFQQTDKKDNKRQSTLHTDSQLSTTNRGKDNDDDTLEQNEASQQHQQQEFETVLLMYLHSHYQFIGKDEKRVTLTTTRQFLCNLLDFVTSKKQFDNGTIMEEFHVLALFYIQRYLTLETQKGAETHGMVPLLLKFLCYGLSSLSSSMIRTMSIQTFATFLDMHGLQYFFHHDDDNGNDASKESETFLFLSIVRLSIGELRIALGLLLCSDDNNNANTVDTKGKERVDLLDEGSITTTIRASLHVAHIVLRSMLLLAEEENGGNYHDWNLVLHMRSSLEDALSSCVQFLTENDLNTKTLLPQHDATTARDRVVVVEEDWQNDCRVTDEQSKNVCNSQWMDASVSCSKYLGSYLTEVDMFDDLTDGKKGVEEFQVLSTDAILTAVRSGLVWCCLYDRHSKAGVTNNMKHNNEPARNDDLFKRHSVTNDNSSANDAVATTVSLFPCIVNILTSCTDDDDDPKKTKLVGMHLLNDYKLMEAVVMTMDKGLEEFVEAAQGGETGAIMDVDIHDARMTVLHDALFWCNEVIQAWCRFQTMMEGRPNIISASHHEACELSRPVKLWMQELIRCGTVSTKETSEWRKRWASELSRTAKSWTLLVQIKGASSSSCQNLDTRALEKEGDALCIRAMYLAAPHSS